MVFDWETFTSGNQESYTFIKWITPGSITMGENSPTTVKLLKTASRTYLLNSG